MEADLLAKYKVPYTSISAAGLHGVGLKTLPGNLIKLARGTLQSQKILRKFRPDVLFFTGGYMAVPMAIAGKRFNSLLYVPDIEPGLALRSLARYSDMIALTAEDSRKFFKEGKRMEVTGYPIRADLKKWDLETARNELHLSDDYPVLLIIGGSKGAHLINQAVFVQLPSLLQKAQVLHLTGQSDWQEAQKVKGLLPASMSQRYHPYPYLYKEIGAAFTCADLAISRAGASTLGEFPFFELPAILVPYPFTWHYQRVNADYLSSAGAAEVIENNQLEEKLIPSVERLLEDPAALTRMRESMKKISKPSAAEHIAELLITLSKNESGEEKTR